MGEIDARTPAAKSIGWLLFILAIAYGIFARLYNLGRWELTIDEYYIVKSIQSILANGLPSFGCGGYYERGLLQQYLSAPFIAYCDNTAFAARILPVIANILAFPVVFALGQKVSRSRLVACVATALFALSLWEIEFARFARMYSFFQLVFVLQLYWLVEIIVEDRIDRYKYLLATTALGIFIYQGVIFSLFLCLLPLVLRADRIRPAHLVGLLATALLIAIRTKINFRNLLSEPRYPPEYLKPAGSSLPIYIPDFMLGELTALWLVTAIILLAAISWILIRQARRQPRHDLWQNLVLAGVLICAVGHQFTLAVALAFIATCFGIFKQRALYFGGLCLLIVGPLAVYWLLFGVLHEDLGIPGTVKLMAKYPSIYWYVLGPFFSSIPGESLILFPVLVLGSICLIRQVVASGSVSAASVLLGVSAMMLVAQSALITPEKSTRYTFFLYPGLLVLFCYFCHILPRSLKLKPVLQHSLSAAMLLVLLLLSENYNPRHLAQLSSAEYNFRIPYHRFLQFHFYQRYSFVDAATYVNTHLQQGDQVIATTPGIDFYLNQLDYSYREISSSRFQETSACSGSKYIWNDSPLIYTEAGLLAQVASGAKNTWVITGENGKGWSPEDQFVSSHFDKHLVFTGQDGQVKVYKIPPAT